MSKLLICLSLGIILIAFQNCGSAVNFSSENPSQSLTAIDNEDDISDVDVIDDVDDVENEVDVEDNNDVVEDDVDDVVIDEGKAEYICILAGAGKSQRLALVDNSLVSKSDTPSTVCTTEYACLEIVSQAFEVKSAEKRGYCKKAKAHSVALSSVELLDLINE